MIVFAMGISLLTGAALGWFGHKAIVRIEVWGRNAQECDRIFQIAEGIEESEYEWTRSADGAPGIANLAATHLRS
jgi:hypothetical protein